MKMALLAFDAAFHSVHRFEAEARKRWLPWASLAGFAWGLFVGIYGGICSWLFASASLSSLGRIVSAGLRLVRFLLLLMRCGKSL